MDIEKERYVLVYGKEEFGIRISLNCDHFLKWLKFYIFDKSIKVLHKICKHKLLQGKSLIP